MAISENTLRGMSYSNLVLKAGKLGLTVSEEATRSDIIDMIIASQTPTEMPDMSYGGPNGVEELEVMADDEVEVQGYVVSVKEGPLAEFEQAITDAAITYMPIVFPMKWVGGNDFADAAGTEFRFSQKGFEYFRYHDRTGISHAQISQLLIDGNMQAFADFTTNAMRFGGKFTAAIYKGSVVGFMKNYHPVDSRDIAAKIREAGLAMHVVRTSVSNVAATIDINVAKATTTNGHEVLAAIRIVNGHSGHVAMGYQTVISVGGFELSRRYDSRVRRHLSQVSQVVDGLNEAMDETVDAKLLDRLQAMSFSDAMTAITNAITQTEKQANLLGSCVAKHVDGELLTGLDLFTEISGWVGTHGYRHAVTTMLQPLADKVLASK